MLATILIDSKSCVHEELLWIREVAERKLFAGGLYHGTASRDKLEVFGVCDLFLVDGI